MVKGFRGGSVGSCVRKWSIWVTELENSLLEQACEALNGMERSQLAQEAAVAEVSRLGIRWSDEPAPKLKEPWPYLPDRSRETTKLRVSVSVSVPLAELIGRAAELVGTSSPQFVLGATLGYIGRLQKCFECRLNPSRQSLRAFEREKEEVEAIRAALRDIKLPKQYRYRGEIP